MTAKYSPEDLIRARYVIRTEQYRVIQGANVDYLMGYIYTVVGRHAKIPDCLLLLYPDGLITPIWSGWCQPAPLSATPTKEEVDICKMLGYTLPVNLLIKELSDE